MNLKAKYFLYRKISLTLSVIILLEALLPTTAFALTGGPSQPEVQSFEPVNTSETVDLFTGDFTYNIPLLDVGGYPVNLSYHAGPSTDEESSWVGLGWNINPGVINRNMRTLPDDFNGDKIEKEFNIKSNQSFGVTMLGDLETFGFEPSSIFNLGFGFGVNYNNYTGVGLDVMVNPSLSIGGPNNTFTTLDLGLTASSESGLDIKPSLSFSKNYKDTDDGESVYGKNTSLSIGLDFNSRAGLKELSLNCETQRKQAHYINIVRNSGGKGGGGSTRYYTNNNATSRNGGGAIGFTMSTYVPQLDMPMVNYGISFSGKMGGELIGLHGNIKVSGYYSGQTLTKKKRSMESYGYLFTHKGAASESALLDFNREKDGPYNKYKSNLPLTNYTYDIYSVSGQGIGGMYRPFRSDVGILRDPKETNVSANVSVPGIEVGLGAGAHGGLSVNASSTIAESGAWEKDNALKDHVYFREKGDEPTYEPYYFKQAGEKNAESDPEFIANMRGTDAVRVRLDMDVPSHANDKFANDHNDPLDINRLYRNKRQRRNEALSFLSADEASAAGLVREIEDYSSFTMNAQGRYTPAKISRTSRPGHHISEVTATRPDGARYVYGIPAYNNIQQEVSFAIAFGSPDCSTGLVSYVHGKDNSVDNKKGLDHYYSKTTMPAYAHSYLLTAILSPDYVDLGTTTNGGIVGPSDDDLGSYTKINYARTQSGYKWRVPYEQANYNEGLKSVKNSDEKMGDDKASYVYGEKEIWYIHSIETRTHVAEFILEDREDGLGVLDDRGGKGTASKVKKLSKIVLYSKEDKRKNAQPTPVKTVNFMYDYSLCQGVPNSNAGGKLTLKEVYFTYGKSNKGRLNSYKFNYANNPTYNLKNYDRWGNYKKNNGVSDCEDISAPLTSSEFPYVDQTVIPDGDPAYDLKNAGKTRADEYAGAWSMTSIELPSGGIINVKYEADDYAYVQDKPAMQMFKITGNSKDAPTSDTDPESGNQLMLGDDSHSYLYFKLQNPIASNYAAPRDTVKKYYIKDITQMYYRFLVKISAPDQEDKYEYVPGYAQISDWGVVPAAAGKDYTYGYIKLQEAPLKDEEDSFSSDGINPISKQAWIFTRLNLPRVAYRQPEPVNGDDGNGVILLNVLKELVRAFGSVGEFIEGANRRMRRAGFGKHFVQNKSWVRLYAPTGMKKGGGIRVKRVTLSDEWKNMASGNNYKTAVYRQEYDYTTQNEYGNKISSGVAAYEPILGNEENPFRQPIFITEKKLLAPDNRYYMEEPLGESFFPAPQVGYSKVTVRSIKPEGVSVTRNGTGYVEHEFYTSKDYPTILRKTSAYNRPHNPGPLFKLLRIRVREFLTASQGYVIELNDMHGKPKAQSVYAEGGTDKVSGITYYYKTKPANGEAKVSLENEVNVIDREGVIRPANVGMDYDFVIDMRQSQRQTISAGLHGNLDAFIVAVFPAAISVIIPAFSYENVRFRSAVVTKVINRYGLIDRVEAFDLGSSVQTKNLLYDAETGEVLLTQTTNQFQDPVYSFTYPAHWVYDRMGQAYRNIGLSFGNVSLNNIQNASNYFVRGDELLLTAKNVEPVKAWVVNVSSSGINAVDINGETILESSVWETVKVIRSGRRNQHNTAVGTIISKKDPIIVSGANYSLAFDRIINASAVEFAEEWKTFCDCGLDLSGDFNPYVSGNIGNWRPWKSYTYLTDRVQNQANNNLAVRDDGIFKSFNYFWKLSGKTWVKDETNWTWASEVTNYSPFGFELENRDALNNYSSAIYGYGNILPKAVGSNAMYKEIGVDDFEDYDYINCINDHFSYKSGNSDKVVTAESHTGRKSIQVGPNSRATVIKQIGEGNCQATDGSGN